MSVRPQEGLHGPSQFRELMGVLIPQQQERTRVRNRAFVWPSGCTPQIAGEASVPTW